MGYVYIKLYWLGMNLLVPHRMWEKVYIIYGAGVTMRRLTGEILLLNRNENLSRSFPGALRRKCHRDPAYVSGEPLGGGCWRGEPPGRTTVRTVPLA